MDGELEDYETEVKCYLEAEKSKEKEEINTQILLGIMTK